MANQALEDFDIVGSYDNERSSTINAERTVNMFEYIEPNGKRSKSMIYSSGLGPTNLDFTPETQGSRATYIFGNSMFQVFGSRVYRLEGNNPQTLTRSIIGTLTTSVGFVGVTANTFQVIFVDGARGYIYDVNTQLFKQITDAAFPAVPIDVTYLDGFFIVINGNTNQFQLSTLNNGLIWGIGYTQAPATPSAAPTYTVTADSTAGNNWLVLSTTVNYQTGTPFQISSTGAYPNPLVASTTYYAINVDATHIRAATTAQNAANGVAIVLTSDGTGTITIDNDGQLQLGTVTSHPGTLVACRTLHRRLFFFSQNFIEVWENNGIGSNLPLRRNNNMLIEVGTPAIGSIVVGFDKMYFLSQDNDGLGPVQEVSGTVPIPVSTRALDYQLAQYAATETNGVSHISDARAILIKENGLIFYRLNFTLANHTFVYCPSMSDESARRWHEEEVLNFSRHPAQTHGYYNGINYYGAYNSPKLYFVDDTLSTNDGEPIRRMRISRNFCAPGYYRMRIDRWQLDLLQGKVGQYIEDEITLNTENNVVITTESEVDLIVDQTHEVQGQQPEVFLSISKDGGQSFGYIKSEFMGKIGERTYRTVWRKLGTVPRGQGFMVKVEFYNKIPFIVLGAGWSKEIMPE